MSRWLLVLTTMLAQAVAFPVCYVQCVGADGHVCLELAGQECHCCEPASACGQHGHTKGCCDRHPVACGELTSEPQHDEASGVSFSPEGCGCRHSLLETVPAIAVKVSSPTMAAGWLNAAALPAHFCLPVTVVSADTFSSRSPQPPLDSRLVVLATVILRV